MISVIVCSKNDTMFADFSENIRETVGSAFEIIRMKDQTSIFQAYNEAQKKAKYDVLLYVHEDVKFHTQSWGKKLYCYFDDDASIGCVGIAGSVFKTFAPSGWWQSGDSSHIHHLIQRNNNENPKIESGGWSGGECIKEVAVVDGVFMAVRKSSNIIFDSAFQGFHCYDLNVAISCRQKQLKLIVTKEVLVEHFSLGNVNAQWVISTDRFHEKYKKYFPLITGANKISDDEEVNNQFSFINKALLFNLKSIAFKHWIKVLLIKPKTSRHFEVIKQFF